MDNLRIGEVILQYNCLYRINSYTYIHMKVFFTCAYKGKKEFQKDYDLVRKTLEGFNDIELISPESGDYTKVLTVKEKQKLGDPEKVHYAAIKWGIELSDVTIIDNTYDNFRLGHEASLAMMNKKPVLVISRKKDMSKYIVHPYLYGARYDKFNIESILRKFIDDHKDTLLNERFNMFMSKRQMDLLDEKANALGVNRSELVRRWIEE